MVVALVNRRAGRMEGEAFDYDFALVELFGVLPDDLLVVVGEFVELPNISVNDILYLLLKPQLEGGTRPAMSTREDVGCQAC